MVICQPANQEQNLSLSPREDDTSISAFTIEGKKGDWDPDKLKCQLLANTIYKFSSTLT